VSEKAVYGGAGDAQHFCDVGGVDALVPKLTGFGGIGVVDLAWASALATVGAEVARMRAVPSMTLLTLANQVSFLNIRDPRGRAWRRQIDAGRTVRYPSVTSESEFR
jgi:hypothetical protein